MSTTKKTPLWLRLAVGLALGGVLALQARDFLGDEGIQNVFSFLLAALAASLLFLWFVLASGRPGRTRLAVAVLVLGGLGAFFGLWRVEGFSGAMVPHFRLRGTKSAPPPSVAGAARSVPDLGPELASDFPGFLGRARDGRVRGVRLARDWSATPPVRLWRHPIGEGWSGFAVVAQRALTLEQREEGETLVAYRLADGEPLWTASVPGRFDHALGGPGPRSTPTIARGRVVALGARGRLACHDLFDGRVLWEHDLLAEWGIAPEREAELVQYGRANSPLVAGEAVIVPVGGTPEGRMNGLVAFALEDGALLWEGPPRQVSFASPTLAELCGERMILIVNEASVSAHAPDSGALLWEHPWPGVTSANASVSQAQPVPPDRVLLCKGYGQGAELLHLARDGERYTVTSLWKDRRALRTKFTNAVVLGEHAYGLSDGILECVRLSDGERQWRAGRYGHGQMLLVEDLLLVLSEEGELSLVEPRPDRPDEVAGRVPVLSGKTWNNLALAGDVLVVRNGEEASAWRLPLAREEGGGDGAAGER